MAAVFDGKTKIGRAVADPATDCMLPPPGSLAFPAITTPVALSGTVGTECKLVHGDRWQQIDQSQTSMFGTNFSTTIGANEDRTVLGNQTFSTAGNVTCEIAGNLMTTIIGAEIRSNIGVQNLSHAAPKTRLHASPECTQDSGSFMRAINDLEEAHIISFECMGTKVETTGADFAYTGYKLEVTSIETEVETLENGAYALKNKTDGLGNFISALVSKATPLEAEVEAANPKAKAISANAGVAVNGDSPGG